MSSSISQMVRLSISGMSARPPRVMPLRKPIISGLSRSPMSLVNWYHGLLLAYGNLLRAKLSQYVIMMTVVKATKIWG